MSPGKNLSGGAAPPLHADETKFIELHKQTQHKLEVIRRQYGAYLGAISQAGKRGKLDASRVFIVEVCCGAGSHLSLDNPRNEVPGTAVQACIEARSVQRQTPTTRVSIRLIDNDIEACRRLEQRVEEFRASELLHPDFVDIQVIDKDFNTQIQPLLSETKTPKGRYCSLWFIDPFGTSIIPRETLRPLVRAGRGVELIINLDVSGIRRKRDAVYSDNTPVKNRESLRDSLSALYGDARWDIGRTFDKTADLQLRDLAQLYADSFGSDFQYKNIYPLEASDGQIRYLIHLTHVPTARDVFERSYKATLKSAGTSKALSITDRDKRVKVLFSRFVGQKTPFDDMLRLPECDLDRSQLKTVLRRANDTGHGKFDHKENAMAWNVECLNPPILPLDPANHTEKRRARKVNEMLLQPRLFDDPL